MTAISKDVKYVNDICEKVDQKTSFCQISHPNHALGVTGFSILWIQVNEKGRKG